MHILHWYHRNTTHITSMIHKFTLNEALNQVNVEKLCIYAHCGCLWRIVKEKNKVSHWFSDQCVVKLIICIEKKCFYTHYIMNKVLNVHLTLCALNLLTREFDCVENLCCALAQLLFQWTLQFAIKLNKWYAKYTCCVIKINTMSEIVCG